MCQVCAGYFIDKNLINPQDVPRTAYGHLRFTIKEAEEGQNAQNAAQGHPTGLGLKAHIPSTTLLFAIEKKIVHNSLPSTNNPMSGSSLNPCIPSDASWVFGGVLQVLWDCLKVK